MCHGYRVAFEHLDRPPLSAAALRRALVADHMAGNWVRDVVVSASTASTNADLLAAAQRGAPEGTIHTTDMQTAGKGRLDREWQAPPASSIAVSILVRPSHIPAEQWSLLPLLTGLAVDAALGEIGLNPSLKWPNDVLVGERKIAGIKIDLARTDSAETDSARTNNASAAVIGIGLNATLTTAELPVPTATSLLLSGADTSDRTVVLRRLVRNFVALYTHWNRAGLLESYSSRCSTLGRQVRVELPGEKTVTGVAREIDSGGRLIVDGTAVASGDVIHVRPVP